jgi:erythromycin esterase-like protein
MAVENMRQDDLGYAPGLDYFQRMAIRDRQMARNLDWLATHLYPREKIIVWAHNYHISKYNGHYPEPFLNEAVTMGGCLTADSVMARATYILGFTSFEGTAGRVYQKPYSIDKPGRNSLERWIGADLPFAFVDFREYNRLHPDTHERFSMAGSVKGNGRHTESEAEWNRVFDGVFYIRNMHACTLNRQLAGL